MNREDPLSVRQHPASVRSLAEEDLPYAIGMDSEVAPRYFTDLLGRKWFEMPKGRHAPGQMLFSRLLHPVVPVSDIINKKTKDGEDVFFSYHVPLADSLQKTSRDNQLFERGFLLWVCKDLDHVNTYKNIALNKDSHVWFDLEMMPVFFMDPHVDGRTDEFFTRRIRDTFAHKEHNLRSSELRLAELTSTAFSNWMWEHSLSDTAYLQQLLNEALDMWKDKKWVRAVVDSTKYRLNEIIHFPKTVSCDSDDCYFELFYETLIERTKNVLAIVEAYEPHSAR